ncbi:zinc finger, CCHC-type containing protein [Tanacetum coccineum]
MAERKNRALKEMVNVMLFYSSLSDGFWGEAMLTAWAVVRLPDPKRKTLGEKGIDYIFVGYAEHSKAYSFYVIEPNDSVSINIIVESRDAIFDENHLSSIPRPKDIIPNSDESQRDDHSNDVPSETPKPRKEAIDDEIGSIMENNTWVLSDLPPGCKPLGSKCIFKRKMKVDGTIDKFKARLVIHGFRQKERIDYFDTYIPVARITTIKLKDTGEADVSLGIKIKHENKVIVITQSHYIEKILKELNREDFSRVSTLMDPVEKLVPNTSKPMDQLEYSIAIRCFMYVMMSTRPDISYAVGRLSRGGAISWASKKQTCITSSTMESEFVALAATGKEA